MKKTLLVVLVLSVVLGSSFCKRADNADPDWDAPAGFNILLEGSATPAVLFIDGTIHSSTIYARVTNSSGTPLAGATIFFEQLSSSTSSVQRTWGFFENNSATIMKVTNANGEVSVTFYSPVKFYSSIMFIHALMQVNDRAYRGSTIPQDYIAIAMINSSAGATLLEK